MSIHGWVDKDNMIYPYNELLYSHKKKWDTDTWYTIDKSWKHYAKWKEPDTRDYIIFDSIHMKYSE
jgi:hypothetical protein